MDRRRLSAVGFAAVALALTGCGPTPPQAPGPAAYQLNKALSTFSTACGHAAEVQAFSKSKPVMAGLERLAGGKVATVARIYRENPDWIFQGKSVRELVQMSVSFLSECGLHRTAARLTQATSG